MTLRSAGLDRTNTVRPHRGAHSIPGQCPGVRHLVGGDQQATPCSGPSPIPAAIDNRPLFVLVGVAAVAVLVVSRWAFHSWLAAATLAIVQLALSVGVAVMPLYLALKSAPVCPS